MCIMWSQREMRLPLKLPVSESATPAEETTPMGDADGDREADNTAVAAEDDDVGESPVPDGDAAPGATTP